MAKRKIALFGGTFDPIHLGHTSVAACAAECIGAEKIVFIPAKHSPLKELSPQVSGENRLKMIALAIEENKKFELSDYELRKIGPGYTLETVREFQAEYGRETSIYWLVGADSVDELSHWYKIADLVDACFLSVMLRAGCKEPDFTRLEAACGSERTEKLKRNVIQTLLIDISSTEIRNRLAAGSNVDNMLSPNVAEYIGKHNLYQPKLKS